MKKVVSTLACSLALVSISSPSSASDLYNYWCYGFNQDSHQFVQTNYFAVYTNDFDYTQSSNSVQNAMREASRQQTGVDIAHNDVRCIFNQTSAQEFNPSRHDTEAHFLSLGYTLTTIALADITE